MRRPTLRCILKIIQKLCKSKYLSFSYRNLRGLNALSQLRVKLLVCLDKLLGLCMLVVIGAAHLFFLCIGGAIRCIIYKDMPVCACGWDFCDATQKKELASKVFLISHCTSEKSASFYISAILLYM